MSSSLKGFIKLTKYDGHSYNGPKILIAISEICSVERSTLGNYSWLVLKSEKSGFSVLETPESIEKMILDGQREGVK